LINGSDNESERLISLFRAAGRVARAHRLADADDLNTRLGNSPNPLDQWDLLIVDDNNPLLPVDECLSFLDKKRLPLPTIVVRSDADLPPLLTAGAHDVVPAGDDQRLMFSALRALDSTDLRRKLLTTSLQLKEAEQRNNLLLGDAAEAIAYIADGMVINANDLFAQSFGYAAADDIDCVPIVDLIAADDQDKFKAGLKAGDGATFSCRGLTASGETFVAQMKLGSAAYEGEPCLQISLQQAAETAAGLPPAEGDADSGLLTLAHLRRQEAGNATLVLVAIDRFDKLRAEYGYCASRQFAAEIGHYLGTHHPFAPHSLSARAGDDCFAVLVPDARSERLLELAQSFALKLAKQHFTCGHADLHGTVSIGLTDTRAEQMDEAIDRAWQAIEDLRAESAKPGIGNGARVLAPERVRITDANQEEMLQEALDDHRFLLLYQPVISLRGASGEHYEVLLRLRGENPNSLDDSSLPENFIESL